MKIFKRRFVLENIKLKGNGENFSFHLFKRSCAKFFTTNDANFCHAILKFDRGGKATPLPNFTPTIKRFVINAVIGAIKTVSQC
jgi:hypothetical protein